MATPREFGKQQNNYSNNNISVLTSQHHKNTSFGWFRNTVSYRACYNDAEIPTCHSQPAACTVRGFADHSSCRGCQFIRIASFTLRGEILIVGRDARERRTCRC
ncbi:uncharacterized protein K489DRAFT_262850 [Dissoconium aciculare CBS 342.82]|uniref:Uncharacterized protein n=1 Tax=Dissoconium aciculare CBS 342.82 TaxID=1314786 RepID=A0A6J3M262_9PEZI|nr:uncharacterized protein K489DRAFT_262850 [Dissoconium aciculare CBS 342.82]KAF1821012.1 hypothetical protein K489DRAFT_262850 [Dissoconium aciculare CBS 342.82]